MNWTQGSKLKPHVQQKCLNQFVHRFTGEHRPNWVNKYPNLKPLYVSDHEWLEHTFFYVRQDGELDARFKYCMSYTPERIKNNS